MSTTGHPKPFSITTDCKSPIKDEFPRPTLKKREHPIPNLLNRTFGRGTFEQEHYISNYHKK